MPARRVGNGVGRPAVMWDIDLQIAPEDGAAEFTGLRLGDLVAVSDWDARYNQGYRRGMVTVGVVVHGGSRIPGHGPGVVPILSGPGTRLEARADAGAEDHLSRWLTSP